MSDTAREFFGTLDTRLDTSRLEGQTLSYRFDIAGAGSWVVSVADGVLSVAEGDHAAETVLRMREETFLRLLRGEQSPAAAFMMGRIKIEGDMGQALKLKELFF
ncbi:MAG: SCP2 sterol-binding domain-containing protein [Gaiellales bacterium]